MDRKTFAGTTIFSAISLFHLFERFTMDPQFSWLPKRCAAKEYSSGGPAFGFQFQRFGRWFLLFQELVQLEFCGHHLRELFLSIQS